MPVRFQVHAQCFYSLYRVEFYQFQISPGHYEWRSDGGDLRGKEYLPVKQLRFGDTGTLYDDRRGRYLLGPLKCVLSGKIFHLLKRILSLSRGSYLEMWKFWWN